MRYLFCLALCASACLGNHVPQEVLDWSPDAFPAADSLAIKIVASQAGIRTPYSLAPPFSFTRGCPKLRVVSDTVFDGDLHSWTELWVYRTGRDMGGHRCPIYREEGDTLWHAKPWVSSSTGRTDYSTWRIHDALWHVDVHLGRGVTYDEATTIVNAVRSHTLVNRLPRIFRLIGDTLPAFDANAILSITTSDDRNEGTHEVHIGTIAVGQVLYVSIVDGKVLVHNIGSYIS